MTNSKKSSHEGLVPYLKKRSFTKVHTVAETGLATGLTYQVHFSRLGPHRHILTNFAHPREPDPLP